MIKIYFENIAVDEPVDAVLTLDEATIVLPIELYEIRVKYGHLTAKVSPQPATIRGNFK